MNDEPRGKLAELVRRYGRGLCDDPRKAEALLRDVCGEHRREISVLVAALRERVAADLLGSTDGAPKPLLLGRLAKRLEDNLGLAAEAARWAVESWALALGVVNADDLRPPRPPRVAPPKVEPPKTPPPTRTPPMTHGPQPLKPTDTMRIAEDQALEATTQALALFRKADAQTQWGDLESHGKRLLEMDDQFHTLAKLGVSQAEQHYIRGAGYSLSDEYQRALRELTRAIELDQTRANSVALRGMLYMPEDAERAIADFNRALELNPRLDIVYRWRGVLHGDQNDFKRALADLNKAIELNPRDAESYYLRAVVTMGKISGAFFPRQRDRDQVLSDLNRAIELDPRNGGYYHMRGIYYRARGSRYRTSDDFARALADHNQAITLEPRTAVFYLGRMQAYKEKGDHQSARQDLQRAAELGISETSLEELDPKLAEELRMEIARHKRS